MQGIAVKKKPLSCTWTGPGSLQLIPSALDFEIIHNGIVTHIDAKAFENDKIVWSALKEHQTESAKWYRENKVNAGLVVWHTSSNNVVFYNGDILHALQKGDSLEMSQGEYLGTYEDFAVGNLFS